MSTEGGKRGVDDASGRVYSWTRGGSGITLLDFYIARDFQTGTFDGKVINY